MEKLTKNISIGETACECGCDMHVQPKYMPRIVALAENVQTLLDFLQAHIELSYLLENGGRRVDAKMVFNPTSWCRCPAHNAKTPGAAKASIHQTGGACDSWFEFILDGERRRILPQIVCYAALLTNKMGLTRFRGVGAYHNRQHLDIRQKPNTVTWVAKRSGGYIYDVDFVKVSYD